MKSEVSSRSYIAAGAMVVFLSAGIIAVLAVGGFSGAVFTSDSNGTAVNQNIYSSPQDVYINGGPNNAASQGLPPNEVFYFEVTDPSGKDLLSSDPSNCRQVQTDANGRVSGAYSGDGCVHAVGSMDVSNGGIPVKLWPFNRTANAGGEYKVVLIRKTAPGVSADVDGMHLDYPRAATKTDNFKVSAFPSPSPSPSPSPTPDPTPTPHVID